MVNGWLSFAKSSPQKSGLQPASLIAHVWTNTIELPLPRTERPDWMVRRREKNPSGRGPVDFCC
jgi:hypothetical protein